MREDVQQVRFTGARTDREGLTWGQQHVWRTLEEMAPDTWPTNTDGVVPVPPGTTIEAVLRAVAAVLSEHETLRTRYEVAAGGEPEQLVATGGTLEVACHEATDGDLDTQAVDLVNEITRVSFDLRTEWPVRFALLTRDGAPVRLVYVTSYLALDGWSGELVEQQLTALVAGEPAPPAAAGRPQPIDLAREERSRHASRAALDFWRRHLTVIPQTMHPVEPMAPERPRWVWVRLRSPALLQAAERLSVTHKASPGSVLLAAFGAALCAFTGTARFATKLMTSNRVEPRLQDYIGNLGTHTIFSVDLAGPALADLIHATHDAALEAYFHGRHDVLVALRLKSEVERDRGVSFDLGVFNYFSAGLRMRHDLDQPMEAIARASTFERLPGLEVANTSYYAQVLAINGEVSFEFLADSVVIPAEHVEPLVMGIETIVVAAAGEDLPLADVPALIGAKPADSAGDLQVDGCLVRAEAVRELVLATGQVTAAAVFADPAPGGASALVGYAMPNEPALTPEALHDSCVRLLPGRRTAMAPGEYVLCAPASPVPVDRAGWARVPVLRRGSGRT